MFAAAITRPLAGSLVATALLATGVMGASVVQQQASDAGTRAIVSTRTPNAVSMIAPSLSQPTTQAQDRQTSPELTRAQVRTTMRQSTRAQVRTTMQPTTQAQARTTAQSMTQARTRSNMPQPNRMQARTMTQQMAETPRPMPSAVAASTGQSTAPHDWAYNHDHDRDYDWNVGGNHGTCGH